jgi:hypothetical protein
MLVLPLILVIQSANLMQSGCRQYTGKDATTQPDVAQHTTRQEAYDLLESLQQNVPKSVARQRWSSTPEQQAAVMRISATLFPADVEFKGWLTDRIRRSLPTPLESPFLYLIIEYHVTAVVSAAPQIPFLTARVAQPIFTPPPFGTLPLLSDNAKAIPIDRGGSTYLLVFNDALLDVTYEFSDILWRTVELKQNPATHQIVSVDYSEAAFYRRLEAEPQLKQRFVIALMRMSLKTGLRGRPKPAEDAYSIASAKLASSMLTFLAGHELMHGFLRHRSDLRSPLQLVGGVEPQPPVEVMDRSWADEIEADYLGTFAAAVVARRETVIGHEGAAEADGDREGIEELASLADFYAFAPTLYFEVMKVAEEARYIYDHDGEMPQFDDYKKFRREMLEFAGDVIKQVERGGTTPLKQPITTSHPPAWLRRTVTEAAWVRERKRSGRPDNSEGTRLAMAFQANIQRLWRITAMEYGEFSRSVRRNANLRQDVESIRE